MSASDFSAWYADDLTVFTVHLVLRFSDIPIII